jgi:hypothetical protein
MSPYWYWTSWPVAVRVWDGTVVVGAPAAPDGEVTAGPVPDVGGATVLLDPPAAVVGGEAVFNRTPAALWVWKLSTRPSPTAVDPSTMGARFTG